MLDTRREGRRLWGKLQFSSQKALGKFTFFLILAVCLTYLPHYSGLNPAAQRTLFILIFAAGLWISEAISAFAVALLVMGLEIVLLGLPGGVFATESSDWEMFIRPWSSPLIWLFFGGFILAEAAQKTRLDRWLARHVLGWFGSRPSIVLLGIIGITFTFSMFMSNTATTAMMMAVMAPISASLGKDNPYRKAILLAVPFAANIGGMGTIIGSPPNAIAAGTLGMDVITFLGWMKIGLPPAILLMGVMWVYLVRVYPSREGSINLNALQDTHYKSATLPNWKKLLVMVVFIATILLWMTGPLHRIPAAVVSFLPITAFAVMRVIDVEDIRRLQWDVLILLAGGLSLGVAVTKTGLATWLVGSLSMEGHSIFILALLFSYTATVLSNFMSNTAAANILIPMGLASGGVFGPHVVIPIALGASAAMCLPISTPPNAIAFVSGNIDTKDFIKGGLIVGLLAPILVVAWGLFVL